MTSRDRRGSLGSGAGKRRMAERVRTARGRTVSQTKWLQRQLNDPYVAAAKDQGLRSRAAFKLAEMDDKYELLKVGQRIVDLGAAPGGWTQIAAERIGAGSGSGGTVVAVDLTPMDPVPGAVVLTLDFTADGAEDTIKSRLDGCAHGVLSDMASPATGHRQTDHLRIMGLAEQAAAFAADVLCEGGWFLCKVLQGGTARELLTRLKQDFKVVRHVKPPASRADSSELYVLATGFRGAARS